MNPHVPQGRRIVESYSMSQALTGKRGSPREIALRLRLEVDQDALVRQLAASALNSKSKPKRATMAHGAVSLTITQEGQPE